LLENFLHNYDNYLFNSLKETSGLSDKSISLYIKEEQITTNFQTFNFLIDFQQEIYQKNQ